MGQREIMYYDELIPDAPDRDANRCYVYRAPNGEVVVHFRNFKIVLHSEEEIREWRDGFKQALDNLGDWFINDIA